MQTRSSSDDDLYDILGVSASADNETIRKAFRKLALQHHPDKLPVGSSHELFVKLQAAYSILRDSNARKKYDCDLQNQRKRRRARTKTTKTKRKKERKGNETMQAVAKKKAQKRRRKKALRNLVLLIIGILIVAEGIYKIKRKMERKLNEMMKVIAKKKTQWKMRKKARIQMLHILGIIVFAEAEDRVYTIKRRIKKMISRHVLTWETTMKQ